ncbi:MAG: hypothetical protein RMK94_00725 [Armatimonadota bacterium]|nr:hypothetical protein [Armatimonadota bacterium]
MKPSFVKIVAKEGEGKVKDMFVINFGAVPRDPENGDWSFVIPNEAITSSVGFC